MIQELHEKSKQSNEEDTSRSVGGAQLTQSNRDNSILTPEVCAPPADLVKPFPGNLLASSENDLVLAVQDPVAFAPVPAQNSLQASDRPLQLKQEFNYASSQVTFEANESSRERSFLPQDSIDTEVVIQQQ